MRRKPKDLFGAAFLVQGIFGCTMRDRGKLVAEYSIKNMSTIVGRNYMLDTAFKGATQDSSWFLGLIAAGEDVETLETDTSASHAGWTEFTSYTGGARKAWTSASAAAGGRLGTATAATFTFNANGSIRGIFVAGTNVQGSTTDLIWATALEDANRLVLDTFTLDVTYAASLVSVSP